MCQSALPGLRVLVARLLEEVEVVVVTVRWRLSGQYLTHKATKEQRLAIALHC